MSEESHEIELNAEVGKIRLNKFLASCGVASRRAADRMIDEGRVEVNGKVVDVQGTRVSLDDFVKVDGKRIQPKEHLVVLLNKPRGYVCSREAQGAEGTVYDLLPPNLHHLNYVGRLDSDSEGLLLMTNDGEVIQKLTHPTGGIEKEYWVTVDQNFSNAVLLQFLKGLKIPEGQAKAKYVCRTSARRACVVLEQGLKRQVRQMFSCLGLRVKKLVRVRIGSLWGGDLEPGSWKYVSDEEIKLALRNPKRPRKYLGARELAAYRGKYASTDVLKKEWSERPVDDDNQDYEFNPADFEGVDLDEDTYEKASDMVTKFAEGESPSRHSNLRRDRQVKRVHSEQRGRDRGGNKERERDGRRQSDRRGVGFRNGKKLAEDRRFGKSQAGWFNHGNQKEQRRSEWGGRSRDHSWHDDVHRFKRSNRGGEQKLGYHRDGSNRDDQDFHRSSWRGGDSQGRGGGRGFQQNRRSGGGRDFRNGRSGGFRRDGNGGGFRSSSYRDRT